MRLDCFQIVNKHLPSVHAYADDTQLYFSFRPESSVQEDCAIEAIEDCITDVRAWLISHKLMLNDSKTELLVIGSRHQLSKINIKSIKVGLTDITPMKKVRTLGSWF